MHTSCPRFTPLLRVALAAACLVAATAAPAAPAAAQTVPAELRVEATGNNDLSHGWSYSSDTVTVGGFQAAPCNGKGEDHTVPGATALGILDYAQRINRHVQPLRVSDEFDFGLLVCGIGGFDSNPDESAFWSYKVNHVAPEVGADQYQLQPGDHVLWVLSNFTTGENSGNELELTAPGEVEPGEPFQVRVHEYDLAGKRSPAAGAEIRGAATGVTDESGRATLVIDSENGSEIIRAHRGIDVPSQAVRVCLARCERLVKQRYFGSEDRDVIDARGEHAVFVRTGRRSDRIDVSGDDYVDRVHCGRGRDRVVADPEDAVARNCERVIRR